MQAREVASDQIPYLSPSAPYQKVSAWMDEYKMTHLPVVENGKYIGTISDTDIFEIDNWDDTIGDRLDMLANFSVEGQGHISDVVRKMGVEDLSCVAIINEDSHYLGNVSIYDLMALISHMSLIHDVGGIIELEMNLTDYSMSQISQIVESNNARILGTYIQSPPDTKRLLVTIKLNRRDVNGIIQTFERYDYTVVRSYQADPSQDNLRDRFDNLMNFMNM